MKRIFFFLFFIILIGLSWYGLQVWRGWQTLKTISTEINLLQLDPVIEQTEKLPNVYPYTLLKKNLRRVQSIASDLQNKKKTFSSDTLLQAETIEEIFSLNQEIITITHDFKQLLSLIPIEFVPIDQAEKINEKKEQLNTIASYLQKIKEAQYTISYLQNKHARIAILLQNQNEPRSTGGFIGSLVFVDFNKDKTITWNFEDVYAIDRLISDEKKIDAPSFFNGLDTTISLKDGNIWPDFPTSASYIRTMLTEGGEKSPLIVIGINLELAKTLLELGGQVVFDQWGTTMNAQNFDTVLQFLVEGKIAGRYGTKEPVAMFMQKVFSPNYLANIKAEAILQYDWNRVLRQKNLLAFSVEPKLQKVFDDWQISGRLEKHPLAENFLHFDFISIGANKSEKFMWTKLDHNSAIDSNGTVINTLKIKRTHALSPGEIETQLGFDTLEDNVKNIMNDDLKWKLGAGQNRTILRVWVPKNTALITTNNPSGKINLIDEKDFSVLEIPLFVLPGESLIADITYETKIKRGSKSWRPYWLQLTGTPGRKQTKLYTSISLSNPGKFSAETFNLGRPVDLIDQDFRVVVEFE